MKTNIKKLMALLAFAPLAAPAFGADAAVYSTKPWLTPEPRQTFTIAVFADVKDLTPAAYPTSKPWIPQGQPASTKYPAVGGTGSFGGTEQSSKPWLKPITSMTELQSLHTGDRVALVCSHCKTTSYATVGKHSFGNLKQGRSGVLYTCDVCGAEGCCYVVKQR